MKTKINPFLYGHIITEIGTKESVPISMSF